MVDVVQRSGKATASLVLGIASFFCTVFAGVPAFILGLLALGEIRRSQGTMTGEGMAVTGIVLSCVTTVLIVPGLLIALLLPAVQAAREAARRAQCSNNLKQISLATLLYSDTYRGHFPPAIRVDDQGQAMHSWRTLVLPFAGGNGEGDINESWDSPANESLRRFPVEIFRCPSSDVPDYSMTDYVAVVGPGFVFDGAKATKVDDIKDGASKTILFVEFADSGIPWYEPRDITFQELVRRVQSRNVSHHPAGFNVVFCDGAVRLLRYDDVDPKSLHEMFTIAGDGLGRIPSDEVEAEEMELNAEAP